ncbi:O-antigen ligase domain-containing protein [Paenibacillus albus]|uniref:O-antigen ligase domain-containing protein n=1 Tax=Paenibacillus albus TaxID=2495582 RepID=A0A3Q8X983_9BACL|nr:O-antigen ligase domain-containing protein [Paenibacillus albus]
MMAIETALPLLIGLCVGVLLLQFIVQLGMRIDAGLVFGYCLFFDSVGYMYEKFMGGSPLFLLVGVPFLLAMIAILMEPGESGLLRSKGFLFWCLFLFFCFITLTWTYNVSVGMERLQLLIIRGFFPGACVYLIYRKYRVFTWKYVLLFGTAYSIIHQIYGTYRNDLPGRLTLGNPIVEAQLALYTVAIALWGKKIPLWLRLCGIAAGLTAALSTQSRGPLVSFVAASLIGLAYLLYKKAKSGQLRISESKLLIIFGVILVLGFAAWQWGGVLLELIGGSRFVILVNQQQLDSDANFTGRGYLMGLAIQYFIEHPIFGIGIGGHGMTGNLMYPHNLVLELLSEVGMFGFGLWLVPFIFSVDAARRSLPLFVLVLQAFISSQFSGDLGFNSAYLLVAVTALAWIPIRLDKGDFYIAKNHIHYHRLSLRRSRNAGNGISAWFAPQRLARAGRLHDEAEGARERASGGRYRGGLSPNEIGHPGSASHIETQSASTFIPPGYRT